MVFPFTAPIAKCACPIYTINKPLGRQKRRPERMFPSMWTCSLLKTNARRVLSRRYGACLACICVALLVTAAPLCLLPAARAGMWVLGCAAVFAILFCIFILSALRVGLRRFFLENRLGDAPTATLFSAFHAQGYACIVRARLGRCLLVALWGLLLIVPGIVKAYETAMVDDLLAENPQMPLRRALQLSRRMTQGEKGRLFLLDLSFLGWWLLCALSAGVALPCFLPYRCAVRAETYCALRAKAFAHGLTDARELGGFYRY